jgi:hypothetical protein
MKDNTIKIAGLLILLSGAIAVYLKLKKNNTESDIDTIINSENASSKSGLQVLQPEFIKAWALAVKQNLPTFTFNGKTYNTNGGKAVKN